jgi:S-adenosylmethionine decarboxylase
MEETVMMEEKFFFEGTEKLLEIWFSKSNGKYSDKNDLRKIPRADLEKVLDLVNCKILSSTHNKDIDAYVLSESSCFITKKRFLLKTCGTTTLLYAVKPIIQLAQIYCGFDTIEVFNLLLYAKSMFIISKKMYYF